MTGVFDITLLAKCGAFIGTCVGVPLLAVYGTGGGGHSNTNTSLDSRASQTGLGRETDRHSTSHPTNSIIPNGPILVCSENNNEYEVHLAFEKNQLSESDLENNQITLKIINKNEGGGGKIVYGDNSNSEIQWKKWKIIFMPQNFVMLYPPNLQNNDQGHGTTASCNTKQVILWSRSAGVGTTFWEVEEGAKRDGVKFKINLKKCEQKSNGKACSIEFAEDGNSSKFKWNNNFEPKVSLVSVTK